jgi:hypothetical protein
MPDLPTLTVTADQAAILLDVFSGQVDPITGNPLTPQQAYRRWLRDVLVEHALAVKAERAGAAAEATRQAEVDAFSAELPGMPE